MTKPVVAYVAGFTAPEGKTMGHAGAIISGSAGTAQAKKEALEKVGVRVGRTPSETARLVREIMQVASARLAALRSRGPATWVSKICEHAPAPGAPPWPKRAVLPGLTLVTASAVGARATGAAAGDPGPSFRLRRAARLLWPGPWRPGSVTVAGLAVIVLLVLAGWIAAPHAGVGLPAVLRTAAALWLVGHHVGFSLRGTGRIGLLPLGLVALPGALLWRAGRWVVRVSPVPAAAPGRLRGGGARRAVCAAHRCARRAQQVGAGRRVGTAGRAVRLAARAWRQAGLVRRRALAPWARLLRLLPDRQRSVLIAVAAAERGAGGRRRCS